MRGTTSRTQDQDDAMAQVRAYLATSLDGFIAGPDDDLSWLMPDPETMVGPTEAVTYEEFTAEIGAMLMGRRTYDVVQAMDHPWPYGETPVLVYTRRPIDGGPATVRAVSGSIQGAVEQALNTAGGRDVYLDGGSLVRQALDAGLLDELIITMIPVVLGDGVALFRGTESRHWLDFTHHARYHSFLQYRAHPRR